MKPDYSTYYSGQRALNHQFICLLCATVINISPGDHSLIALREARVNQDYLAMGKLLNKMLDSYEQENDDGHAMRPAQAQEN